MASGHTTVQIVLDCQVKSFQVKYTAIVGRPIEFHRIEREQTEGGGGGG